MENILESLLGMQIMDEKDAYKQSMARERKMTTKYMRLASIKDSDQFVRADLEGSDPADNE